MINRLSPFLPIQDHIRQGRSGCRCRGPRDRLIDRTRVVVVAVEGVCRAHGPVVDSAGPAASSFGSSSKTAPLPLRPTSSTRLEASAGTSRTKACVCHAWLPAMFHCADVRRAISLPLFNCTDAKALAPSSFFTGKVGSTRFPARLRGERPFQCRRP